MYNVNKDSRQYTGQDNLAEGQEEGALRSNVQDRPDGRELQLEIKDSSETPSQSFPRRVWTNFTRRDLKHFRKFMDSTTTHGLPRIFSGTSIIRRLFWFVLFFAALGGCLYNIAEQISFLLGNPTSTLIEFERVDQLAFPAITVCNYNFASEAKMEMLNFSQYFNCVAPYPTLNFEGRVELFMGCSRGLDSVQRDTVAIKNVYRNAAQSAQDFIIDCSWPATTEQTSCSWRNFTEVVTSSGVCYQLNGNDFRPRLVARGSGRRYAITLLLDVQQYDYLDLTTKAGVLVSVHPPSVSPQPLQTGISVPPGTSAAISMDYTRYEFPDYKCGGNLDALNFFNAYSVSHCVLDKQYTSVAATCQCVDPASPDPKLNSVFSQRNITPCLMSRYGCVVEQLVNATERAICQQDCLYEQYNPRVSYLNYPVSSIVPALSPSLPPETAADPSNNLIEVNVFFETFLLQKVIEEPSYDALRLLADIGGFLGLFVGVSVISVTECLVWLLDESKDRLLCVDLCKRKATKPKWKLEAADDNQAKSLAYMNPLS